MFGNIIGALIGRSIDRSDGGSGTKGAIVGGIAPSILKRVIPLAILAGGIYAVKTALDNRNTPTA